MPPPGSLVIVQRPPMAASRSCRLPRPRPGAARSALSGRRLGAGREALAVVLDGEVEAVGALHEAQPDDPRVRVLDDVVQRFLHRQEQVVADVRAELVRRQVRRHVEAQLDAGQRQVLLGELADVGDEAVERIVPRIDGPDDLVHRPRQLARRVRDLAEMAGDLVRRFATRQLAEQRDLGQPGAEIVVDVAGDAIAIALDRALQLEPLDLAAEPARADEAHGAGDDEERAEAGGDLERARLVEVRQDHERHRRLGAAPAAVAVAGGDAEAVAAGRQVAVVRRALGAGFDPVLLEAFDAVAEPHLLRRREAETGVAELEPVRTRRNLQRRRGLAPGSAPGSGPGCSFSSATGALVEQQLFEDHVGRRPGHAGVARVDRHEALGRREPQPAVAAGRGGRLIVAGALERGQAVRSAVGDDVERARRGAIERRLADAEDALVRADPQLPRLVLEDLADDVARQAAAGGEALEAAVAQPQQAAAERAGPQRAVGVDVQRPDRVRGLRIRRTEARQLAIAEAIDRAVARADPHGAVRSQRQRPHVAAFEAVLGAEEVEAAGGDARHAALGADPQPAVAIGEQRLDAVHVHRRRPDAAPVEVEEILAIGAQPDAAGGVRHHREDEPARRRVGHRIAGERAVAIALQAVAHRPDPHRAVAVGGHRGHRDLARAVRGQRLEPRVADADEAGALDGQPDVPFPILEQVADAGARQSVGAGDAAGAAVRPDVQHALAEVRQPDAAAAILEEVDRHAEGAGQAAPGLVGPDPRPVARLAGAAVGHRPQPAVPREAQHRDVEPRLAVGRRHGLEAAAVEHRDLGLGADPHPAVAVARQALDLLAAQAGHRHGVEAPVAQPPQPAVDGAHPQRARPVLGEDRQRVAGRTVDVPGAVRVAAAPDHRAVIDDEDRLAAARSSQERFEIERAAACPFALEDPAPHRGQRAVVGVGPQRAGAVDEQVLDAGVRQRRRVVGIEGDEAQAVEAEQPVLRPDPQVAVGRLGDGVDEAGGQAAIGAPDVDDVVARRGCRRRHDGGRDQPEGQREARSDAHGSARGYTGRGAVRGASEPLSGAAPAAQALEERRQIGGGRRRDLDGPPIDRVRERQLERVQRLPIEGDRVAAGRPASAVAAIADQRMAAQLGLHANLSLPAGRQPHFQERRRVEGLDDAVVAERVDGVRDRPAAPPAAARRPRPTRGGRARCPSTDAGARRPGRDRRAPASVRRTA